MIKRYLCFVTFSLVLFGFCAKLCALPAISAQINGAYSTLDWAKFDSQYVYSSRGKNSYIVGAETNLSLPPLGGFMLGGFYFPQVKYHAADNSVNGKRDNWLLYAGTNLHYSFVPYLSAGLKLGLSYRRMYNEVTKGDQSIKTYKGQAFSPLMALYLHFASSKHYFIGAEYWHFWARNTADKLQDGVPENNLIVLSLGYHFEV